MIPFSDMRMADEIRPCDPTPADIADFLSVVAEDEISDVKSASCFISRGKTVIQTRLANGCTITREYVKPTHAPRQAQP